MFMANRTIAFVFLLIAPCLYGQDNSLERPASDFDSKGVGLTETLLKFSHQQHLRIAVEYIDGSSMDQPIVVNLQNKTVRQGLDTILSNGHGYSWRLRNGIVEITNRRRSKRADKQLNVVIPVFKITDGETAKMASVMLWWNLQLKLDPNLKGYGGDILGGVEASTVKPAVLHNRTVREILAYIALNSRAEGWIVAGPPQCLGFTPHCGLWLLIESVPSAPSYELLLQNIRKNL
jgi:hypothetical protein